MHTSTTTLSQQKDLQEPALLHYQQLVQEARGWILPVGSAAGSEVRSALKSLQPYQLLLYLIRSNIISFTIHTYVHSVLGNANKEHTHSHLPKAYTPTQSSIKHTHMHASLTRQLLFCASLFHLPLMNCGTSGVPNYIHCDPRRTQIMNTPLTQGVQTQGLNHT